MITLLQTFLTTLTIFTASAFGHDCNDSMAVFVDGMCFIYNSAPANWYEAKERCAAVGMHLATVRSPEIMKQIMKVVTPGTTLNCWLGASDLEMGGRFIWEEDRKPIDSKIWSQTGATHGQGDRDCVYIDNNLHLNEALCSEMKAALCMYQIPARAYYFGEMDSYMCHCMKGGCDHETGYCVDSQGRCATGWFGTGCQYRSLSSDRYGQLGVLVDNDDNTCTSDIELPLTVKLKAGSFFSWIRLIVKTKTVPKELKIYFHWNNMKIKCQRMMFQRKRYPSMDVTCEDGPFVVDEVILSWTGKINICSVYVNGERNFALLQSANATNGINTSGLTLPIDGRRGPADECYQGQPEDDHQSWTLIFTRPKVIHEIIIYRRPNVSGYEHMTGFYVQGYNTEGQILFHYRDNGENARNPTVWILTHGSYSTDKIVVSLDNPDGKRHLELCEIEAFGECSPLDGGGVYCDSACDNDTCWDGVCHGDHCVVCIAGLDFEGRCIVVKNPPCVEKDRSRMWLLMAIDVVLFIVGIIMGVYSF